MANVTIPNLPQVTGTTDLDILVITDSGETTTSKITKADLLSGIGGAFTKDASGNVYIDSAVSVLGTNNFYVPGSSVGNTWTATDNNAIILSDNSVIGRAGKLTRSGILFSNDVDFDFYNAGSNNSSISSNGIDWANKAINSTTLAANGCNVEDVTQGAVIASRFSDIKGGISPVVIASQSSDIITSSDYSMIAASLESTINGSGKDYNILAGARLGSITARYSGLIGGQSNQVNGERNGLLAGQSGLIDASSFDGAIIGGSTNYINGVSRSAVIAGSTNTVRGNDAVVIGGQLSEASAQGSVVIGSNGLTISDQYTTGMDNTYVKSHMTYGTYSGVSIGNEQLFDADNGMVQYFDNPAGNLNIRTVNVKNGEVYDMIIGGAGGVAINSVGANDVGFTAVDNTNAATSSYLHVRIAVVNNLVVFSTL